MTAGKAIQLLRAMQEPEAWDPQITEDAFTALDMAIDVLKKQQISETIKQAKQNLPVDMSPLLSKEEKQQNRWYAQGVADALKVVREERAISGNNALDILNQFEDAVENGEGDECKDCEAYECYKNGIYAKCPRTGFFDDCARAEREHNEAGGWR